MNKFKKNQSKIRVLLYDFDLKTSETMFCAFQIAILTGNHRAIIDLFFASELTRRNRNRTMKRFKACNRLRFETKLNVFLKL